MRDKYTKLQVEYVSKYLLSTHDDEEESRKEEPSPVYQYCIYYFRGGQVVLVYMYVILLLYACFITLSLSLSIRKTIRYNQQFLHLLYSQLQTKGLDRVAETSLGTSRILIDSTDEVKHLTLISST